MKKVWNSKWGWGRQKKFMYYYRPFGVASSINKPLLLRGVLEEEQGPHVDVLYNMIDLF